MKPYKFIQRTLLFVCSFIVLSCSHEEEYVTPDAARSFDINVMDSGISSNDPQSRATDTDFKTTFSEGDQIGLFAVKNDAIIDDVNNVRLTYDGTKWTVTGGGNLPYTEEQVGAKYFAYYPYSKSLTSSFDPTQADPFTNIVSQWMIGEDLEGDKYTNKDLMTSGATSASGSGEKFTLDFIMSHRMALVVVELPAKTYNFTNPGMSSYSVQSSGISFEIAGSTVKPFYDASNENYRLLVKPETELTIDGKFTSAVEKKYAITIGDGGLTKGTYAYYTIDGGNSSSTPVTHTLQIGDYYCADGSLVSRDDPAPANAIGIVYQIGTTDAIKADYPSCDHGLVYALKRVEGEAAKWSTAQPTADWYGEGTAYDFLMTTTAVRGYEDTRTWMGIEENEVDNKDINSVMKATLNNYRESATLPSATTNWYLPSVKEMVDIEAGAILISASLTSAGGDALWVDATTSDTAGDNQLYWSSTVRRRDAVYQYHPDKTTTIAAYLRTYMGYYRYSFGF